MSVARPFVFIYFKYMNADYIDNYASFPSEHLSWNIISIEFPFTSSSLHNHTKANPKQFDGVIAHLKFEWGIKCRQ